MNEENINALDEIHKGACMGKDAIHFVIEKVEDNELKEYLNEQYNNYQKTATAIEEIYPKYNDGEPHKTSAMNKMMTWYGIEMKTMTDKSDSKIAELLLQGTNMGIIEGRKILNKKKINEEVNDIISKYIANQEDSVEFFKGYL